MKIQDFQDNVTCGGFDNIFANIYKPQDIESQESRYMSAVEKFTALYPNRNDIHVYSAPGRTEIGGNHTDHQHGCVIAGAVDLDVIGVVAFHDENIIRIKSEGYDEFAVSLDDLDVHIGEKGSSEIVRGIAARFKDLGVEISGFDMYTTSNVLGGSGISSSAAFETLIATAIDSYYNNKYFSDAGWCAYDSMNMPLMENAVKAYEAGGIDAGEQVLIQYYQTDVKDIMHWLKNKAKPFRERYELIKCAFDDHFAERYHTSVPLFLIIIDGAVNDYTKSKGFFAEGTDVSAWDCLVGCGDGLTKIKDIFKKGRNKTNHDEIRLPYRNGILHGRDLNYANKYVSCKCISLMFALADWMNMKDSENTRKQKFEKECNPPPISESLKKIKQNAIDRQEIQKWVKRDIKIGETISATPTIEECKDFPYLLPLISAFNAWSTRNYGSLSVWFKNVFSYESSDKKRAGECRKLFDHKNLISYELEEIEERALALTKIVVLVKWKSNDIVHTEHFEFGCSYQQEDGNVGYPWKNNGAWILIPWKIQGLYK